MGGNGERGMGFLYVVGPDGLAVAALCFAESCHAMLCYALLCCATLLCFAMQCSMMLCYASLCSASPSHVLRCYAHASLMHRAVLRSDASPNDI